MITKDIEVLAEHHTHAGRRYHKGDLILGVEASSADWLIGTGRAKAADPARVKQLTTKEA